MTINPKSLVDIEQRLQRLLTEKKVLNSKVICDAFEDFKESTGKAHNKQGTDIKAPLKRLELALKNEGAYKNVKVPFEDIKTELLQIVDSKDQKSDKAPNAKKQSAATQLKKEETKNKKDGKKEESKSDGKAVRATTVTISQTQERRKRQSMPAITRPVIHDETANKTQSKQTHLKPTTGKSTKIEILKDATEVGPADMSLLNRTISRLYHLLEIDRKRPDSVKRVRISGSSNPRPQGSYSKKYLDKKTQPKSISGPDAQTLTELKTKLEKFEKQLKTKLSNEKEELKTLQTDLQHLRTSWTQQEKQLERLKGTHMITHKAKGKHVELLEERRMADKKDIEDKLSELEENIRKNLIQADDSPRSAREDLAKLKTEILKVHRLLHSRLPTPAMLSPARKNRSKIEADDISDMVRLMVNIGEEIQHLHSLQEALERCEAELKQWNIYVHDVDLNLDELCQNSLSAKEIVEMDKEMIRVAARSSTEQERKTEKMKMKIKELKKIVSKIKRGEIDNNRLSLEIVGDLNTLKSRLSQLMEAIEDIPSSFVDGRANSVMTLQSYQSLTAVEQFENSLKKLEDMKAFMEQQKRLQVTGDKFMKDTENDVQALKVEIDSLSSHVQTKAGDIQLDSSTYRVPKFGESYVSTSCQILIQKLHKIHLGVDKLSDESKETQKSKSLSSSDDMKKVNDGVRNLCLQLQMAAPAEFENVQNVLENLRKCQLLIVEMDKKSSGREKNLLDVTNTLEKLKNDVKKVYEQTDDDKMSTILEEEDADGVKADSAEKQLLVIAKRFETLSNKIIDLQSKLRYEKEQNKKETVLKESEAKLKLQVTVREQELHEQNKVISRLREDTILKNTENTRLQLELNDRYRSTLSLADEEKIYLKNKIEDLTRKLDGAEKNLNEALKEKYGLLTRLSAAAGTKLFDGTLSIWDHSDPYRPIKMAERFSDLFDNEWSSAHQTLINHYNMDEKETVQALLEVITEAFSFCVAMADIQISEMHKVLFLMNIEETKDPSLRDYVQKLSDEDIRQIRDIRKWSAPHAKNKVLRLFITSGIKLRLNDQQLQACENYASKCVELCWLMCVQTPPLYLSWSTKSGERFEHSIHRQMFYNKGGEVIDYLVWPTLHIMKNGDVLCKGIVRTKKSIR